MGSARRMMRRSRATFLFRIFRIPTTRNPMILTRLLKASFSRFNLRKGLKMKSDTADPTESFRPDSSVYMIFRLHQHLESFQVFGLCYPEEVAGLDPRTLLVQDTMLIALEDETGYIKLDSPSGVWKPGRYRVEIHVGWRVNEISLMGTMRFTVQPVDRAGCLRMSQHYRGDCSEEPHG